MRLFVYGTLRSGGSNHHLLKTATVVAKDICLCGYAMYNFGPYPFVEPSAEAESMIYGEIYEIPLELLPILDRLEDIEHELYERIYDSRIEAWLYVSGKNAPHNLPKIKSGDWFRRS